MKRDNEIAALLSLRSIDPRDVAAVLPSAVCRALVEIAGGTSAGLWCGARRRVLERVLAIGVYSACPSVAARASDGSIVLTPFGGEVLAALRV